MRKTQAMVLPRARHGQRTPDGGNDHPILGKESDIGLESGRQSLQRFLLLRGRRLRGRQDVLDQSSDRDANLFHRAAGEMHQHRGGQSQQGEAGQQCDIEAQIQAQHQSCALANT